MPNCQARLAHAYITGWLSLTEISASTVLLIALYPVKIPSKKRIARRAGNDRPKPKEADVRQAKKMAMSRGVLRPKRSPNFAIGNKLTSMAMDVAASRVPEYRPTV